MSSQHRHQPTSNQPLRHRHISGLQQGVWHSVTLHPDGEVSPSSPSRLRLHLAGWLLHKAFTLYCLPWSSTQASTLKSITASIIQGSSIGPAAYVVNASDLNWVTSGNQLCKFADDTYLVIPASNVDSRATEIDNIETWARTNNLKLNRNKSNEIVFSDPRRRRQIEPPPPTTDVARVTSHVSQNSRRHNDKWTVRLSVWPCPWRHQIMRADPIRAAGPARARHVSRGATGHLPVSRHRQAALRIQCLDWIHQTDWPAASRWIPMTQHPQWLLFASHSYICRTVCDCGWTII